MIMEAEKSQDLHLQAGDSGEPTASTVPTQVQRPGNQGSQQCKFQSKLESKGRSRLMSLLKNLQAER